MVQRLLKYALSAAAVIHHSGGYWPELGTVHNAFALQHIVGKAYQPGSAPVLWDLQLAVDKSLLASSLGPLGVHGYMLCATRFLHDGCLQSMWVAAQFGKSQLSVHWPQTRQPTGCHGNLGGWSALQIRCKRAV